MRFIICAAATDSLSIRQITDKLTVNNLQKGQEQMTLPGKKTNKRFE